MLCVALENIGKTCGRNIAGVAKIQLIELGDIISVPRPQDGVMTGNIVVKSANSFVTWTPDMLSVFSEERKSHSTNKDYYEPSLFVSFSRDRALLIKHHTIMAGKKYAVIVTDRNGVKRFVKVMQNLSKSSTGDFKGKNYYEFRFFNQLPTAAPILVGDIVTENLLGGGLRFDGVLHHVDIPYQTELDPCESVKPFTIYIDYYQTGGVKVIHTQNVAAVEEAYGFYINSEANKVEVGIFNGFSGGHETFACDFPMWNSRIKLAVSLDIVNAIWKLYINGNLQATKPFTFTNQKPSGNWQIGGYFRDVSLQQFEGFVFDFQYFSRDLSLAEVQNLTSNIPIDTNKLAHYRLDEDEGLIASDSITANNGVLQNYTPLQVSLGASNCWVDNDRNPKT
jgi:hypothetical protein